MHIRREISETGFLHLPVCLSRFGGERLEPLRGLYLFLEQAQHERVRALPRPLGQAGDTGLKGFRQLEACRGNGHGALHQ